MEQEALEFEGDGGGERLRYLLALPPGYSPSGGERWPLILFLHGSGERGLDLDLVKKEGIPRLVEDGGEIPFVVVSPQCPPRASWSRLAGTLVTLVDDVIARHAVDPDRVYLTGISMGGYATWSLAAAYPDRFAALVPICGGGLASQGVPGRVKRLRDIPVWAFHGALDDIVPVEESQRLVDALRAAGGHPRFTVYPDAGHDSWTRTYDDPAVYEWLLRHRLPRSP